MKNNMIVPKKINVGYQKRPSTYTGKLSYVTYYDQKNKLRKKKSWEGWRDKGIKNDEFENVPVEGFVLNKKAGGYSTGWNYRQSYIRVYDPRGFEFEITIENLIYILENCNSIKGKGIEGELVYAWDGPDLVLTPVDAPDYKELMEYNKTLFSDEKVYAKDLIIGGTYKTSKNVNYVYLGRFDKWQFDKHVDDEYGNPNQTFENKGKHHFFGRMSSRGRSYDSLDLVMVKSPTSKFIKTISKETSSDLNLLLEELEKRYEYSPVDNSKKEYIEYTYEELVEIFKDVNYSLYAYVTDKSDTNSMNKKYTIIECEHSKSQKQTPENRLVRLRRAYHYYSQHENYIPLDEFVKKYKVYYSNSYLKNGRKHRTTNYFERG